MIPSLAILIICVPYLGVGTVPAVVALTVLAIPPILINTAVALRSVPTEGVGTVPAVVALTVLAIPPILINTAVALRSVPTEVIEAGVGRGMSPARLWLTVKAPLAFPLAFSGVRTAASEIIASATLAAYIGAGGLGKSSHPQHSQRISGRAAWVSSSIQGSERSVTTDSGSAASPSPCSR